MTDRAAGDYIKHAGLTIWLIMTVVSSRALVGAEAAPPPGGGTTASTHLTPSFATVGRTYRVVNHETVRLPCQPVNADLSRVVWRRGTRVLTAGNLKISPEERLRLIGGGDSIADLELSDVQTTDAGDYVCQLGTIPPIEVTHTVEVLVPPVIQHVTSGGNVQVNRDATVLLECRASGNPVPTITWTRKNNLLPNGEKSQQGPTLTIPRANRHHAGVYRCTASNEVGQPASQDVHLSVYYAPEIEVERPWVHSGEGFEAELVCSVHAEPPAEVFWLRDTLKLDTTETRIMDHRGTRHSLLIRGVQDSDFGNYSCVADNSLGKARQYLELSGKPSPVIFRSKPMSRYKDQYNITWEANSYSPINEYRLFFRKVIPNEGSAQRQQQQTDFLSRSNGLPYRENHSQHLQQKRPSRMDSTWADVIIAAPMPHKPSMMGGIGNVPHLTQQMSYLIRNLDPGATYEAQVAARNRYGWGHKTEGFRFHTRSSDELSIEEHGMEDDENMVRDMKVIQYNGHSSAQVPTPAFCLALLFTTMSVWSF